MLPSYQGNAHAFLWLISLQEVSLLQYWECFTFTKGWVSDSLLSNTSIRWASIKKSGITKGCWGCWKTGILTVFWWECQMAQPFWKAVWQYLVKLKIYIPYNPAIPFLVIYSKAFFKTDSWSISGLWNRFKGYNIFYKWNRTENIKVRIVLGIFVCYLDSPFPRLKH